MAICGTGMGSLAGLLKNKGYEVVGSDQATYPPMSDQLAGQNIAVFSPFSAENLKNAKPDLVIVGNAISKSNPEAAWLIDSDIPYISMPQALNHFFLADKNVIVVSGTHGKTTTTALMAHLLHELGTDPSFLVGGVTQNFSKNFKIGSGQEFVIEGDEYDTAFFDKGPKFLHYNPRHVIMTSLEFDHADIYDNVEQIQSSFEKLAKIIPADGSLQHADDYPLLVDVAKETPCKRVRPYGTNSKAWQIKDYVATESGATFSIAHDGADVVKITSPLPGLYNAQNVAACFSVLEHLGYDLQKAANALVSFKGIKRRQEILFESPNHILIDDFAHHPTAVSKTIKAVKDKFPQHHLIAIFEPRSNTTRRNVFQKQYTEAFADADEVIMTKVDRPEKVTDGQVLDVPKIIATLKENGKPALYEPDVQKIASHICRPKEKPVVALVMSNGHFNGLNEITVAQLRNAAA